MPNVVFLGILYQCFVDILFFVIKINASSVITIAKMHQKGHT